MRPGIPSIAGQPRLFIENQLVLIREGMRPSPEMLPFVKDLKDAEIVALAKHFAFPEALLKIAALLLLHLVSKHPPGFSFGLEAGVEGGGALAVWGLAGPRSLRAGTARRGTGAAEAPGRGRDQLRRRIDMDDLDAAAPELDRNLAPAILRKADRLDIVRSRQLLDAVDMAAERIEQIEAIVGHEAPLRFDGSARPGLSVAAMSRGWPAMRCS